MDKKNVAIIVAHPDDETLWAGGLLLDNSNWECVIISLCRKFDPDRSQKFYKVLHSLNALGTMGNLDDGPHQNPQDINEIQSIILGLLPRKAYDLMITHSPSGEYTRHLRHEEVGKAAIELWMYKRINAKELWLFAYEDGNKTYLPRSIIAADYHFILPEDIWQRKYDLITKVYGFNADSWEAKTTPKTEAFWILKNKQHALKWLEK